MKSFLCSIFKGLANLHTFHLLWSVLVPFCPMSVVLLLKSLVLMGITMPYEEDRTLVFYHIEKPSILFLEELRCMNKQQFVEYNPLTE